MGGRIATAVNATGALMTGLSIERIKAPKGKLPFIMGEQRDLRDRLTCMRLLTIWQGFLIIREVASVDEARIVHGELEKLLVGASARSDSGSTSD